MRLAHLLRAKRRTVTNYRRSGEGGWRRLLVFLGLGLAIWAGILFGSEWFLDKVVAIEPIGVVMLRKLLGLVLLFVLSILMISNLIAAFSTFYLAEDLQLLIPRPIPSNSLYAARFVENCVYASWMTLLFVTPFFVAAGWVMHAAAGYYLTLVPVLVATAILPTSLAVVLCMVLGVLFSAQRTRQGLLFVASLVFAVVFVLFRNLEPERFLNPDERAPLLEVLGRLQSDDVAWLPSTWAIDALWPYLGYAAEVRSHPVTLLLLGSTAAFFIAAWVFRSLYRRAFSRAQEGVGGAERRRAGRDLAARLGARLRWIGGSGLRRAIVRKDFLVFVRDTAQWSQAFLIALLVVIYVVNFRYIRSAGESGIISPISLHFVNLALGGFVAVAVCVRFAFPSVSLEGKAFWLIACSPNRMRDFLGAKWLSLASPLIVLVGLLVVVTSVWLGSETTLTVASAIVVVPLTIGLCGLGLGLGARYPRFGIDNAAKIAAGFGGVLYMFVGMTLLLVVVIASIQPTLVVARLLSHGLDPGLGRAALAVALTVFSIGVPLLVGRVAVRVGARHLELHGNE